MTTALIDGDIAAYRMAAWCESNQVQAIDGRESVIDLVRQWATDAGAKDIIVALSHPKHKSFRYSVLDTYKHNRKNTVSPEFRRLFEDVLRSEFRSIEVPHLEADDLLGIMMTNGKVKDPVCVSIDKDLLQIPGQHYNPVKPQEFVVTPDGGTYRFHIQWLIGDSGDGYGGIYRFGIKKAESLLEQFWGEEQDVTVPQVYDAEAAEAAIVDLYNEKNYEFAYCLQMAQVAKILTAEDWYSDSKKIRLFEPKTRY
jgi:DNA polymerase I